MVFGYFLVICRHSPRVNGGSVETLWRRHDRKDGSGRLRDNRSLAGAGRNIAGYCGGVFRVSDTHVEVVWGAAKESAVL